MLEGCVSSGPLIWHPQEVNFYKMENEAYSVLMPKWAFFLSILYDAVALVFQNQDGMI